MIVVSVPYISSTSTTTFDTKVLRFDIYNLSFVILMRLILFCLVIIISTSMELVSGVVYGLFSVL